ncbi:hypothetical protein [Vulcanisaeta distributa]|uniref:hypothetical protein n=1 Tax=Vulcanisaeta distributa TaxID=164451 RepID=UPI000A9DED58|nr:hypothetical protein [Vulcanisaeta distributa]
MNPEIAVLFDVRLLRSNQEVLSARKLIVNAPPSRELVMKYAGDVNGDIINIDLNELRKAGIDYSTHVIDLIINTLFNDNT